MFPQELLDTIKYDPITGVMERTLRNKNVSWDSKGYRVVRHYGKAYLAHRIAFYLYYGYLPQFIDHINGKTWDNRIENLRPCTLSQNNMNQGMRSDNKTGVKGVHWYNKAQKYRAVVGIDGKKVYVGLYDSLEEAAEAVKKARESIHKEFYKEIP